MREKLLEARQGWHIERDMEDEEDEDEDEDEEETRGIWG
jgi:hypothetical protein